MARYFYPKASLVTAVSRGVARDLACVTEMHESTVHTVFNPIVSESTGADAKLPLQHPWFREGEPPVVLAVGKLKAQKDFAMLLRAFARLRRARRARLVILGEGPERGRLRRQARRLAIAGDVEMPGFVSNPFAYMSRAGVFALSSAWEGLPTVLVEAMACGCPVVSTACQSGPEEILEGGIHGQLVPVGDDCAFSQALSTALDAPRNRASLRARASNFSVPRAVDGYLRLLFPESSRCADASEFCTEPRATR